LPSPAADPGTRLSPTHTSPSLPPPLGSQRVIVPTKAMAAVAVVVVVAAVVAVVASAVVPIKGGKVLGCAFLILINNIAA